MNINKAYEECKKIIDYHSKSFAKAFSHLPKEKRQAVWAVYAFCRTADDIVDEGRNPEEELNRFRLQLDEFAAGKLPEESALWVALADSFNQFEFDLAPFYDMLKGQEMDLVRNRYLTLDEVLFYSYHVASTVGLMLLPILAPEQKSKLEKSAVSLGYAMQLTNILRDIGEDLEMNRVYIPEAVMAKHGYTITMLRNHVINPSFINMWEELAGKAEKLYEEGLELISLYPVQSRLPVKAAAHFYKEILKTVRQNGYDVFRKRAVVSKENKQEILTAISE